MKSLYHDKFYNFQNSFAFNKNLKRFFEMFVLMCREQDLHNLLLF